MADDTDLLEEEEQFAQPAGEEQAQQPADQGVPEYKPADTGRPTFLPNARPVFLPDIRHEHPSVTGTDRPVFLPHIRTDVSEEEGHVTPVPLSQYDVAPRALTPEILAARQTAEQYGGDFSQRAQRAGAVGASEQQAQQFAQTTAPPTQPDLASQVLNLIKTNADPGAILNTIKSSADSAASQAERGSYELASKAPPPAVSSTSQQLRALQAAKSKYPDLDTRPDADNLINSELTAIQSQDAKDTADYQDYQKQQAQQAKQRADAAEAKIDPNFAKTPAGAVSKAIGENLPGLATATLGPIPAAAQMGTQAYMAAKDEATDQLKQLHPDWSDQQIDQTSHQVATTAFQAGALAGFALTATGNITIPLRGIVTRTLGQMGLTAGTQALVSGGQRLAENYALKQQVPQHDIWSGVPQAMGSGAVMGGLFGGVHALTHPGAVAPAAVEPTEVAPPVVPPAPVKPDVGERGAPIRGAETKTLEQPTTPPVAQQPPVAQPVEPVAPEVAPTEPVAQQPVVQPAQPPVPAYEPTQSVAQPAAAPEIIRGKNLDIGGRGYNLAEPRSRATQNWEVGKTVDVGFNKGLTVISKHPDGGYILQSPKGDQYHFAPHQGLVRLSDLSPPVVEPVRPSVEPVPEPAHLVPAAIEAPAASVTQEDVARRAYELSEQRARNGQPGTPLGDWAQAQQELARATEPILPATVSEAEPINSAIANRYVQERMARGELGQIDPSQGKSTEDMVQHGLQMSRNQRDGLIDNFMKGKGGDLDQQGAAIRSKEAMLSEQSRAASRAAAADPANQQLQAQANAALDAVTAFHNGPIKEFKRIWSDSGRVLQREIPLDYTTLNGMKEAYFKGNDKEAPPALEPKLKKMAETVSKTADAERVAMNNLGKEIEEQTRGKTLPVDDQIRIRLMEIMKDLPCRT